MANPNEFNHPTGSRSPFGNISQPPYPPPYNTNDGMGYQMLYTQSSPGQQRLNRTEESSQTPEYNYQFVPVPSSSDYSSSQMASVSSFSLNPNATPFRPSNPMISDISVPKPSNQFKLNPNAPPFQPSYSTYEQCVPPYANAPMYDGYTPSETYEYQGLGQQPQPQFTSYMEATGGGEGLDMAEMYRTMYDAVPITAGQQFALSPTLCERMMCSKNAALLQEVQVGLEQLMVEPDEFETWSGAIRDRLVDRSVTDDALSITSEIILQMATLAPSVQYNLSRLCALLSKDVDGFRQLNLLPKLHEYHEEQRKYMSPEQLQNLLLFFAEVYDKLELETGGHIDIIGVAVCEQLRGMLNVEAIKDAGVKTVIQVLKLTGRHLDAFEKGKSAVDELLTNLNAIAKGHPAISDSVKQQIISVSALRENNWGVKNHESFKGGLLPGESDLTPSSSGFFIGPDGQPLNDEEKAFLEENLCNFENNDDNDVCDDYEQFLFETATAQHPNELITTGEELGHLSLNGGVKDTENKGTENPQ